MNRGEENNQIKNNPPFQIYNIWLSSTISCAEEIKFFYLKFIIQMFICILT